MQTLVCFQKWSHDTKYCYEKKQCSTIEKKQCSTIEKRQCSTIVNTHV
jgi:hypothetical protein